MENPSLFPALVPTDFGSVATYATIFFPAKKKYVAMSVVDSAVGGDEIS